jgi:hypothetical protein
LELRPTLTITLVSVSIMVAISPILLRAEGQLVYIEREKIMLYNTLLFLFEEVEYTLDSYDAEIIPMINRSIAYRIQQ